MDGNGDAYDDATRDNTMRREARLGVLEQVEARRSA